MEFYHVKVTIVENAILKTLIYADIFDYPLKAWEIHKWLIGKELSLKQMDKALILLIKDKKIESKRGYFFLKGRKNIVSKRKQREKISKNLLNKILVITNVLKLIPWVKLIGISGSLAMGNASKNADIDLFVITSKSRLWLSRILLLSIAQFFGNRRKRADSQRNSSGKFCINILLEEDNLGQENRNIYLAHEVLQMKVLYDKESIYQKFLEQNEWAFKYLPNWKTSSKQLVVSSKYKKLTTDNFQLKALDYLETLVKNLQLNYMGKPQGMEKVTENALYFHPEDKGEKILKEYNLRLKKFKIKT